MRFPALVVALLVLVTGTARSAGEHGEHAPPSTDGPPILDGLGTHSHPVTTRSPEAQRYFDQGLRLVYGFNHDEAIARVPRGGAARPRLRHGLVGHRLRARDRTTTCRSTIRATSWRARPWRRQSRSRRRRAPPSATTSMRSRSATRVPPAPIACSSTATTPTPCAAWRASIPDDLDAATLYAESLMVLRPWKLWTLDGKPAARHGEDRRGRSKACSRRTRTTRARTTTTSTPSRRRRIPERALPSAQRLAGLAPAAGHLVHMPSHIYMRVGRYADAAEANRRAIAADERYIERDAGAGRRTR